MAAASLWEREEGRGGAAEDGEGGKMRDEEGDVGLGVLTTQPREEKGGRVGERDRYNLNSTTYTRMYIPPMLSPRGPKKSSTLLTPVTPMEGTRLTEADELGLMMSLTG